MAKIKFRCACGKTLAADEAAAGKKAKCTGCGQIVRIPSPERSAAAQVAASSAPPTPPRTPPPPPPPPPPLADSMRDDEFAIDLAGPKVGSPSPPSPPAATANLKKPSGVRAKFAIRRWWFNWAAFLVYLAVVWIVSRSSPIGSLLLVMPVFFVAVLIFLCGGLWYFAVLCRDSPGQAASLFFALLRSFVSGGSATAAGRRYGMENRDKPANPRHARPIAAMKFGALGLAFALGATLIVGILLGTWTKENFRRARFRQFDSMRPTMHEFPR